MTRRYWWWTRRATRSRPRTQPTPRQYCGVLGAQDQGGSGYDISDLTTDPPRLDRKYVRDEALQARELTETLAIFDDAGVDGAFVHTFIQPPNAYNADPRFDFDWPATAWSRATGTRIGGPAAQFPGIPWDLTPASTPTPACPGSPRSHFTPSPATTTKSPKPAAARWPTGSAGAATTAAACAAPTTRATRPS